MQCPSPKHALMLPPLVQCNAMQRRATRRHHSNPKTSRPAQLVSRHLLQQRMHPLPHLCGAQPRGDADSQRGG